MCRRRWCQITLLFVILVVGICGGINYVVDPFSRREDHVLELARLEINRNKNVPLWSVFSLEQIPKSHKKAAEVVILGDSRATLLTQKDGSREFRLATVSGYSILNLSLGGGSIEESLSFFDYQSDEVGRFPSLKKVVVTLPFNRMCEPEKVDRIKQSVEMADNPLLYYLNGYVLKTSIVTLVKSGRSSKIVKKNLTPADGERALKAWKSTYLKYDVDRAREREISLRMFVEKMNSRGVEVIFYQPPGGGSGSSLMRELGLEVAYQDFLAILAKMGRLENFGDQKKIDGKEFSYKFGDPIHHDQGLKILQKILQSEEPTSFPLRMER